MAQVGKDQTGTPVMELRIRKLPKEQNIEGKKIIAVADILTPLGVLLLPGIEMQVDSGDVYAAQYQLCIETGCMIREPLIADTVNTFKAGAKLTVSMITASQGEVKATLSLRGFTRAFKQLK
jgi:invasion protein IalB